MCYLNHTCSLYDLIGSKIKRGDIALKLTVTLTPSLPTLGRKMCVLRQYHLYTGMDLSVPGIVATMNDKVRNSIVLRLAKGLPQS